MHRTSCRAKLGAEIWTSQIFKDLLRSSEKEHLVRNDRTTDGPTELFAMKVFQRFAIRRVRSERFQALEMKKAAMQFVSAGLRYNIDHTTGTAAKLCRRAGRYHLKFLYCIERDIDGRALSSNLFAEETVVVVAAVKADVVEDSTLPGEVDFVAIRPLHDAYSGSQRQQIFELSSQNWRRAYRPVCKRSAGLSL